MKKILIALFVIFMYMSCETAPLEITEDMPVTLYLKKAQDEEKNNDLARAILYYEALISNYPDDIINITKAEFEIARLHYKMGKIDLAEQELLALKEKYKSYPAGFLPEAEYILTEKLLSEIEAKKAKNNPQ